ncbi:MAG TPA: hypothetical protein VF756_31425 [Thermoanaerobaculia bacterium]
MFDAGLSSSIAEVIERFREARARLEEIAAGVPRASEEESEEDIEGTPDPRTQLRASLLSVAHSMPAQIEELERAREISEGRVGTLPFA